MLVGNSDVGVRNRVVLESDGIADWCTLLSTQSREYVIGLFWKATVLRTGVRN